MRIRILMNDSPDPELLKEIKSKHEKDIEGINELYDSLITHGTCSSEMPYKAYYVAYTLGLENIDLTLVKQAGS